MTALLILFVVCLPFLEIVVAIWVLRVLSQTQGFVGALLVVTLLLSGGAAAGMALVRRQGLGILQAAQEAAVRLEAARRGEPAAGQEAAAPVDLFGRLSLLLAGLLLLVPGFVTDLMALTLLFPPTRWAVGRAFRLWLRREHAAGRVSIHMSAGNASFSSSRPTDPRDDGVIDTVATPIAPPGSDDPGRRLLE